MSATLHRALADEILAEVKRQRFTATEMQARTGIKSRSWQNWLVNLSRPVPLDAVWEIGEVLGVNGSELMRRAEARAAELEDDPRLAGMSPEAAAKVREVREEYRPSSERPRRAANG